MQQETDQAANVSRTKRNPIIPDEKAQGMIDSGGHENTAERGSIGQIIILTRLVELG